MPRYEEEPYYEKDHIIRHTFFEMLKNPKILDDVINYYNVNKDIINLSDDDRARIPCIISYDNKLIEWCIDVLGVKVDHINRYLQKLSYYYSSCCKKIFSFLINKYYQDHPIPIYGNIFDCAITFLYQLSPQSFTNDVWCRLLTTHMNWGLGGIIFKTCRFVLTERFALKCIKKLCNSAFHNAFFKSEYQEFIFYLMLYSKRNHKKRYYKTYPPYIIIFQKKMKILI